MNKESSEKALMMRKTEGTGLHHHYSEITLRYPTGQAGQADFTGFVFDGKCGVG